MIRILRHNSHITSVVLLITIEIILTALAAHGQMTAVKPKLAFKNSDHMRRLSGPNTPLFSLPRVYDIEETLNLTVATADLNGDGKLDVVAGDSNGIAVLLGNGDGTLQSPVVYPSGGGLWWPGGLAVADLRKGGFLDVVVAIPGGGSEGGDSVGVLLGNGDGAFQPVATYDSGDGGGIYNVVLDDLDRDGKTDIILFNPNGGSGRVGSITVLPGNGDGTFQRAKTVLENTDMFGWGGIAVADLNSDGKEDLVVSEEYYARIDVLLGNGDGTFGPPVFYDAGGGMYLSTLSVADVNKDGKLDILDGNMEGDGISVLLGNGDGTFQPAQQFGTGNVNSITVVDVNGDGKKDLVVACGAVGVLLGNGDGTFQDEVFYDAGGPSIFAAVADLNGDGKKDVVTANLCSSDPIGNCVPPGSVSVLLHAYATTATLVSSPNPSVYGQAITFTVSVSSKFGTPTGKVVLLEGSNELASASLLNGSALIPVSSLAVGSFSITAEYQGGPGYLSSTSNAVSQVVSIASSTILLASSVNPAPLHEYVTYTATVTSQYGGAVTGTVTFQDGSSTVATVDLREGQATFTTNYTITGTHTMTATYSGDQNNSGNVSAPLIEQVITGLLSKTTLTTSVSPTFVGEAVTFTATVTSGHGPIPDGELVIFYDSTTMLGSNVLTGGSTTYTTSSLSAKTHTIKATYQGDTNFQPSTGHVKQVVLKNATTTSLSSSPNPSHPAEKVTFTAVVTPSGSFAPTGKVKFWNGTSLLGTAALKNGVATLVKAIYYAGTYPITAQYLSDAYNDKSTSPVVNQVVQ